MKRSAILLNLLVVFSLLLAACAPAAAPGAAPAAQTEPTVTAPEPAAEAGGEVSREDTLIYAKDLTDILTLDPAVAYEFSGIQAEASIYETLVSFVPGQPGVKPLLAESWESKVDGDMNVITFKLNPNAKFASGNPVTAEDVVFSWSRALDLDKSPAFLLKDIIQLKKENMAAVDATTFEVKLPKEVGTGVFLSVIVFTVAGVVEKAVVEANMGEDMGSTWLNDNSAGSGPFVLNKWDRDVAVVLDANPNYWGTPAKVKRVIMQNIVELGNLQAAIETGDADIVQGIGPEQTAALEGNPDIALSSYNNTQLVYLGMNAQVPPFDNADVREAVRYAINYDEIMTLLGGNGALVQEVIPSGFLGHTGTTPFSQDLDKAKELLAKAGVAEGTEFTALVGTGLASGGLTSADLAAKVQSDLAKVGLTMNIKQLQVSELLNIYRSENAADKQMVFILWGPDFADPDGNVSPFTNYALKSIAWRNGWDNPEIAELGKQAAAAPTDEERIALYAQLTERVQHEGPYVVLYQPKETFAARSNIEGFFFDPADTPSITFANIGKK